MTAIVSYPEFFRKGSIVFLSSEPNCHSKKDLGQVADRKTEMSLIFDLYDKCVHNGMLGDAILHRKEHSSDWILVTHVYV